jgi:hypothetical protein
MKMIYVMPHPVHIQKRCLLKEKNADGMKVGSIKSRISRIEPFRSKWAQLTYNNVRDRLVL